MKHYVGDADLTEGEDLFQLMRMSLVDVHMRISRIGKVLLIRSHGLLREEA